MYFRFWFSVQTKLCSWLSLFSFLQTQKALNCPQNFHLAFNIQEWVIVRKLKGNYASFGYQVGSFVFVFLFYSCLILSNHIRNYSGGIIIFSEQEQYLSCNCCICVTFWILEIFLLKNMNKLINTLQMEPFMLLNALYYPKTTTCLYRPDVFGFFCFFLLCHCFSFQRSLIDQMPD